MSFNELNTNEIIEKLYEIKENKPLESYYSVIVRPKNFYKKTTKLSLDGYKKKLKNKQKSISFSRCWENKCYGNGIPAQYDKTLGLKGLPFAQTRVKETINNKKIYDVLYFHDDQGFRHVFSNKKSKDNFVFLGCSFTYGEGLQNWETIAFNFSKLENFNSNVFDFSYSGFGPHHVLRILQSGLINQKITNKPKAFLYYFLPSTIMRTVNAYNWTDDDPKFVLKDGKLVDTNELFYSYRQELILKTLRKSALFSFFEKRIKSSKSKQKKAFKMAEYFLRDINRTIEQKYKSKLFVIVEYSKDYKKFMKLFAKLGIEAYYAPDLRKKASKACKLEDGHPSPNLAKIIAQSFYETSVLQTEPTIKDCNKP